MIVVDSSGWIEFFGRRERGVLHRVTFLPKPWKVPGHRLSAHDSA